MAALRDFFISFNKADRAWAAWIAWTLEQNGYSVYFQDWDFATGTNFVLEMDRAARESKSIILVLSDDFLRSSFAASEWATFFAQDPAGKKQIVKPIRVRECHPEGLLATLVYADLVGLSESDARTELLNSVVGGRRKPKAPTAFPGASASIYPGPSQTASEGPLLWIYFRTSIQYDEAKYTTLITEIRSAGHFRLIEDHSSARPEDADLALVVLESLTPSDRSLEMIKQDLETLQKDRIPTRVYVRKDLREGTRGNAGLAALLNGLDPSNTALFSSDSQLLDALKSDLVRVQSRVQQSIDEDGYLATEHRAVVAQFRNGAYGKAERLCRSLLKARPFSPRAHYNMACILTRRASETKTASRKQQLFDSAQESLAQAVRFGIVQFTREFVIGDTRSREDAEKQILGDPDLRALFEERPYLRDSIKDPKRIQSGGGGGGGCIEATMPVELSDGSSVPLYQLADSQEVMCWNEGLQAPAAGMAANIKHYVVPQLVIIDEGLRVSPMHPVLTADGWRPAGEIKPSDLIMQSDGTVRQVQLVTTARGAFDVVDLTVTPHSNLSVRRSIVHNMKMR